MSQQDPLKFARANGLFPQRQEWSPRKDESSKLSAVIGCPFCGSVGHLDHEISLTGIVTPSIDCPDNDCTFHDWGFLVGWPP